MPLSEHEQRLLDQIERALYQEDPKFASAVKSTDLRTHMRRRLRRAALVLVVGFVVMVGALLLAMTAWKRLQPGGPDLHVVGSTPSSGRDRASRSKQSKPARHGSIKDRLEERWKRRWDERGGER